MQFVPINTYVLHKLTLLKLFENIFTGYTVRNLMLIFILKVAKSLYGCFFFPMNANCLGLLSSISIDARSRVVFAPQLKYNFSIIICFICLYFFLLSLVLILTKFPLATTQRECNIYSSYLRVLWCIVKKRISVQPSYILTIVYWISCQQEERENYN